MRTASGPEPVREPGEIFLVDRVSTSTIAQWTILSSSAAMPAVPTRRALASSQGSDRDFAADFDDRIHRQSEVLGRVGRVALHEREQCLHQRRSRGGLPRVKDAINSQGSTLAG